jgi:hypothetical protein
MPIRTYTLTILTLATLSVTPALGKDAERQTNSQTTRDYTTEESSALGAAADRRAKAQQQQWDKRLNAISGSICRGC